MIAQYPEISANFNAVVCEREAVYAPRQAEESILYGVVAENLETFLARQERRERTVPRFVEREFRSFLDCGIPARGFLRIHCDECGLDRALPFSCKGRGFCESCGARRMADTAAHLVDRVFPEVPVRQWVLTLPYTLRFRMAYDSKLVADIHRIFAQTVFAFLRRKAGNVKKPKCGAVTFIQRFGDALNLNLHYHLFAVDGVYSLDEIGNIHFLRVAPPTDKEVAKVAERIARRIERMMIRLGMTAESGSEKDAEFGHEQPLLAELYGASISGRVATGPKAGRSLTKIRGGADLEELGFLSSPRCASVSGVNVHANVCIAARDRIGLERILRYAARPPVATERLSGLPDGRLLYRLKRRWRDGTTQVIYEPLEFLEKLAALVPPPRFNLVRYSGVLAPASGLRRRIIPVKPAEDPACNRHCNHSRKHREKTDKSNPGMHERRYAWAEVLKRVFSVDSLKCERCGAKMRIVCAVHPPEAIKKILDCLGIPSKPPPIFPAVLESDTEDYIN